MSAGERFVALLAGLFACLAVAGAGLRYLVVISARMGQLVERLDGHLQDADRIGSDHEARLRDLERRRR